MPRPPVRRSPRSFVSKARFIWTDNIYGTFAALRYPRSEAPPKVEGYEREEGDNIVLQFPSVTNLYENITLTDLTSQELDYVEAVFARAIEAARPIVERRDANAKQSLEDSDGLDSDYSRAYRQVPTLFVRKGHGE